MNQSRENGKKALIWRQKVEYFGDTFFFLRNRASSLFYIYQSLTSCKKSEKSNGGKYENFWERRTDRWTDGGGFIRTPMGVLIRSSSWKKYNEIQSKTPRELSLISWILQIEISRTKCGIRTPGT